MKQLLRGAKVLRGGALEALDVCLECGAVAYGAPGAFPQADATATDLTGLVLTPGLRDLHVHLREPGFPAKETIASGTRAAARGGFTQVCAMPNLNPPPDSAEHLAAQLEIIRRDAVISVYPVGAITQGQKGGGELADMAALAPNVCGFSDDGVGIQDGKLMRRAMETAAALGKPIISHCEDQSLLGGGYIHAGAYAAAHGHRGICAASEWVPLARDLELARQTGCSYHVCHVSTKESVELIRRAKAEGVNVTAETAPHYLLLNDGDLEEDGRFKMNPPLRSREDQAALLAGILDGAIDCIATDHAPHTRAEKGRGLAGSAFGIVGLETAFALLYTYLVKPGRLPFARLMELMSLRPGELLARWMGIQLPQGDLCAFDLETAYTIDPEKFASQGRATPFAGRRVYGAPHRLWHDGHAIDLNLQEGIYAPTGI
ncbi:MAG: dihydroorotase [Oscillospiraceae bacterium]|jgi:dihydroorotase|nr:dihydroorotase [Oscillospiraceae bacterium]